MPTPVRRGAQALPVLREHILAALRPFPPGTSVADRKYFREALETLDFSAGEYIIDRATSSGTMTYAYPVLGPDRRPLLVLFSGYELPEYGRFLSQIKLPEGYIVFMTDWKGVRLFRAPEDPSRPAGKPIQAQAFAVISGSPDRSIGEWMAPNGSNRIHAFRQLRLRDGLPPYLYTVVSLPKDRVLYEANRQATWNLTLLASSTAIALVLTWLFGNAYLARPLNLLVNAAERFGAGELNTRSGMSYTSDEVGQLAKSFDEMASLLEKRNAERKAAEDALGKANEELEKRVQERTAELTASERRLRLHLTLSPLAVTEWTPELRILTWNPAAERIFGYTPAEVIGQPGVELLVRSAERPEVENEWRQVLNSKGSTQFTSRNQTRDNRTIFCKWYSTALIGDSGEVIGVASLVEDVTENHQLQEQLLHSQKMDAIGRLAGGVAHDFNNLLMVIRSYSELLREELASERQRGRVQQILKACERASDMTRQLLAFSRRQTITPRVLDLNRVVRDMWTTLPRLIGEQIVLEQQLANNVKLCKADPTHVEQVVLNLVVNARDAMPQGGCLRVATANVHLEGALDGIPARIVPGWYSMLAITDNGTGMDATTKARIFEPFFTTKEVGKGTGLGLSTVYGIVKQNDGYIHVESELGRGTTFRIYLPSVEEVAADSNLAPQGHLAVARGSATILLVDDEAALREAGAEFLRSYGYQVIVAGNGEEALRLAQSADAIDVLVTDVVMPGLSGQELAQQLMAWRPDTRVLYMSGYSGTAGLSTASPSENYVQKPFSFAQLAGKIQELLRGTVRTS
jgi:PAS domain S-box-containing protein